MRRTRRITRRAATRSPAARIVVVTEGGSTEPTYLRTFGRIYGEPSAVRLNIIPAAGDPRAVVERAITEWRKLRGDSLPLLRHVIVNDNKSSTYKLGLLRTLVRLAETAPGLVIERTDDYVDIPFGAVGLYWLKQYLPLVLRHRLPQRPSGPGGYGWAREAFHRLGTVSPSDLRLGARFDADRAVILTRAINDACGNIEKMPVRYITHPGSE